MGLLWKAVPDQLERTHFEKQSHPVWMCLAKSTKTAVQTHNKLHPTVSNNLKTSWNPPRHCSIYLAKSSKISVQTYNKLHPTVSNNLRTPPIAANCRYIAINHHRNSPFSHNQILTVHHHLDGVPIGIYIYIYLFIDIIGEFHSKSCTSQSILYNNPHCYQTPAANCSQFPPVRTNCRTIQEHSPLTG